MKVASKGGGDFPKPPEGLQQGVCVDVVDLGLVDYSYQGVPKGKRREVRFIFQVAPRDDEDNELRQDDGERFSVSSKFTASLGDNARLLPFLENWLGAKIPQEVRDSGFDMEALIGRNAQLTVVYGESKANGRVYANINGILPIDKKTPKLKPENYTRVQDREGYVPPFGSELWELQQGQAPGAAGGNDEADDSDDDLPF
jgi:hypothetical protein